MDEAGAYFFLNMVDISSSSSSEDEFFARGPMEYRPRIRNYVEAVVNEYSDDEFIQNFRMNRYTFNHILALIEENITTGILDRGRHTISAKEQFLIALWYFGSPDSYRSICGRFNIGRATALRSIRRVTNSLLAICPNIIVWPTGNYFNGVKNGFSLMGMRDTIGCIDGMHVPIPKPKEHGQSYINRKKFASLVLQGVCDHTLKFTHCYAGQVGSTHDSNVLRRSEVWEFLNNMANDKFPEDSHLLGDKAYPCLPQLITPYRDNGHLTENQRNFNFFLSRSRMTIERAFGLLQKRFRCLKDMLDVRCLEWASKYIIACCVLHNICIMQNDILQINAINDDHDDDNGDGEIMLRGADRERGLLGRAKRDRLCHELNAPEQNI